AIDQDGAGDLTLPHKTRDHAYGHTEDQVGDEPQEIQVTNGVATDGQRIASERGGPQSYVAPCPKDKPHVRRLHETFKPAKLSVIWHPWSGGPALWAGVQPATHGPRCSVMGEDVELPHEPQHHPTLAYQTQVRQPQSSRRCQTERHRSRWHGV